MIFVQQLNQVMESINPIVLYHVRTCSLWVLPVDPS
jgi:hypothetical protein